MYIIVLTVAFCFRSSVFFGLDIGCHVQLMC